MQNAQALVHECSDCRVSVARKGEQLTVIASEAIAPGQPILEVEGVETTTPSVYSVQITETTHIDLDDPSMVDSHPERYLWRFLNHHCKPNSYLRGRTLVAIKQINIGDEVTFNYNANEYDMASPFQCWCDTGGQAVNCTVRGYRYLNEIERGQLAAYAAPHVKRLAEQDT